MQRQRAATGVERRRPWKRLRLFRKDGPRGAADICCGPSCRVELMPSVKDGSHRAYRKVAHRLGVRLQDNKGALPDILYKVRQLYKRTIELYVPLPWWASYIVLKV